MTDYYVDATGGSDAAAGTSEGTAWQTIAKVKSFETSPGFGASDTIRLKLGEIFYDLSTGSSGLVVAATGLTFGSYGSSGDAIVHFAGPDNSGSFADAGGGVWTWTAGVGASNNFLFEDSFKLTQVEAVGALFAGSYFFDEDDGGKFHYMPSADDPTDHIVTRGLNKTAITAPAATVENLHFRGCPVIAEASDGTTVDNIKGTDCLIGLQAPGTGTLTVALTNSTFNGLVEVIRAVSQTTIGVFHDGWTVSGNVVASVDDEDLNLMNFKNQATWRDREVFFIQNAHNWDVFDNTMVGFNGTYHADDTLGFAHIISFWNQNAAGQCDSCDVHHNTLGPVKTAAINAGATSTYQAMTDFRAFSNDIDGAANGIEINTRNTSLPSQVFDNNMRNVETGLQLAFGDGCDHNNNIIRASDYFVKYVAAHIDDTIDNNTYYGSAIWSDAGDVATLAAWKTATGGEANSYHEAATVTLVNEQDFREATATAAAKTGNAMTYGANTTPRRYFNSSGVMVAAANNLARLNSYLFSGSAWASKGLLIEGGTEQIALSSEDLDSDWTKQLSATVVTDQQVAPDGATTIDEVTDANAAGKSSVQNDFAGETALNDIWCASVFVRKDAIPKTTRFGELFFQNYSGGTGTRSYRFATDDGEVRLSGSLTTVIDNGVTDLDDFWRFWFAIQLDAAGVNAQLRLHPAMGANASLATSSNAATGTIGFWGPMLHKASYPSSYIEAIASNVTRNLDDASIALNINSPLTCVVYGTTPTGEATGVDQVMWEMHGGDTNDNIIVARQAGNLHVIFRAGGVEVADLDMGAMADDTDFKLAFACDDGDFAASLDGGAIVSDAAGNAPDGLTTIELGQNQSNAAHWFGHIDRLWVYDERKANAWLQSPSFTSAPSHLSGMRAGVGPGVRSGIHGVHDLVA